MTTIKITEATTQTNSMSKGSRVVGMTLTFDNVNFDYESKSYGNEYKVNDYRPMLDGEYRLFLYPNGIIELEPKAKKAKNIKITKYEIIN